MAALHVHVAQRPSYVPQPAPGVNEHAKPEYRCTYETTDLQLTNRMRPVAWQGNGVLTATHLLEPTSNWLHNCAVSGQRPYDTLWP